MQCTSLILHCSPTARSGVIITPRGPSYDRIHTLQVMRCSALQTHLLELGKTGRPQQFQGVCVGVVLEMMAAMRIAFVAMMVTDSCDDYTLVLKHLSK